jgi:hypothetical protein
MAGSITVFDVRQPDINAIAAPLEPYSVAFRHNDEGLSDARRLAAARSIGGRELVIVELVDGKETGKAVHLKDGREA